MVGGVTNIKTASPSVPAVMGFGVLGVPYKGYRDTAS